MKIELIASGDEITTGRITDTNSARLAFDLTMRGFDVSRINAVGDGLDDIEAVLLESASRADAVICAGGLGPTSDDLTSEAAARAGKVELEFREAAWRDIEARFAKINLPISPTNKKQAYIPAGADILHNPVGTAPGYVMKILGKPCFFAPGVPSELFIMFDEKILPRLEALRPGKIFYSTRVRRTFGYSESGIGELLHDLLAMNENLKLSYRAVFPEIIVGLSLRSESKDAAESALDKLATEADKRIGQWVYTPENKSMPEVVGDLLRSKKLTLAVAESCTGGLVGQMITDVAGSSDYFLGGAITYANRLKIDLLGVPSELIDKEGAVSEACAKAMAEGIRKLTGADIGLGVTGIAGPGGGTPEKPVGTVFIAISTADRTEVRGGSWPRGDRDKIRLISAFAALDLLRRSLL